MLLRILQILKGGKIFVKTNLTGLPNAYREYLKNAEAFATYKITKSPPITFTFQESPMRMILD